MEGLSIIIPTYNSYDAKKYSIKYTLLSIERQYINIPYEVIIVDNGSKDGTIDYLNKEKLFFELKIFHSSEVGNRSFTRNLGVEKSKFNKILFLDDDTFLFGDNVIMNAYKKLKNKSFCCGAKRYWMKAEWDPSDFEHAIKSDELFNYLRCNSFLPKGISRESGYRDLQEFTFIANYGLINKYDFELLDGFNEELFPSRREDVALMYDCIIHGLEFVNLHNVCSVIHLTHPMIAQSIYERIDYHEKFRNYEIENNYHFRVNTLFGIDEGGDNEEVLKRIC